MKKRGGKKFKWRGKETEPEQTQNTSQHNAAVKVYKKREQNNVIKKIAQEHFPEIKPKCPVYEYIEYTDMESLCCTLNITNIMLCVNYISFFKDHFECPL